MFELDETQSAFADAVRGWCEKELAPAVPALEVGEQLPYELLRRLGRDLGIAELLGQLAERRLRQATSGASEERASQASDGGGFSDDPLLASLLFKEVSRVSPGFGMVLMATLGCGMALVERGSAEVIESCAMPVLRFEKVGCWALTEPAAGSDAFGGMRTTAHLDGDALVLNGQKTFISNAPYADVFAVYARVAADPKVPIDERPVRAVAVPRGTPGLETGPPMRKMGMHDSPTGEIFLRDCRVPRSHLVGSLESAAGTRGAAALDSLTLERAVMPAMCLGIIERCVEESVRYATQREQFGRPIGEFQGIGFKLARMELALENARNLVFKLAWAQTRGKLDARLASIAKLYCAEEAVRVALDAIQIHGGSGYMAELPLEKLMRDAKMFEIGGGTNEIQLQTIARSLLSAPG
ncbi:MAG: acyl-CoA dehydrogenase family protein [Deltaproteobacteria bacterium]|nr:acyl-CoA dehydrogenase family protein [Deltaproteobacteria bacterium]MBW2667255.1 acyl-CoA dehydrogenase family protein [Deltaproteobacteria bacterium]